MLSGIIIVFLVCHTGEIFLSLYEMYDLLDGQRSGICCFLISDTVLSD